MRIGELSKRSGIAASAIRYYERQGLLRPAARVAGQRRFDESALAQLVVIRLAQEAGFTLTEIRRLADEFPRHRWRRLARAKRAEIAHKVARLTAMSGVLTALLRCDCFDLAVCGQRLARSGLLPRKARKKTPRRRTAPGAR